MMAWLFLFQEDVNSNDCGSAAIAQLALALKPRYHFTTGEGAFYERTPYRYTVIILLIKSYYNTILR
jgi:hypothetical protein